jgi:hypothetical protein
MLCAVDEGAAGEFVARDESKGDSSMEGSWMAGSPGEDDEDPLEFEECDREDAAASD